MPLLSREGEGGKRQTLDRTFEGFSASPTLLASSRRLIEMVRSSSLPLLPYLFLSIVASFSRQRILFNCRRILHGGSMFRASSFFFVSLSLGYCCCQILFLFLVSFLAVICVYLFCGLRIVVMVPFSVDLVLLI